MSEPLTTEQRKNQMFAAQTHSATLARLIYEAQQRGESSERVGGLVEQKAEAEATWLRLSHEIHGEVSVRSLMTFMDKQEADSARVIAAGQADTTRVLEAVRGLGKRITDVEEGQKRQAGQISDIGERLSEVEATVQAHGATIQAHNESRDRSIEQRAALEQGRQENAEAIALARQETEQARSEARHYYEDLSAKIAEMRALISASPSEAPGGDG
jgi:chromosome segregation ATPase